MTNQERELDQGTTDDLDDIEETKARDNSDYLRETIWEATRGLYPQGEAHR